MANYDFIKDIHLGEAGETIVLKDLESMGAKLISDNKNNKYDLLVERNNQEIKYEIKTDVFCAPLFDTGNMFIEFECRGKTSGLYVTEADWFVTYFKYLKEIWYIKTDDLKQLIEKNKFIQTNNSGDDGSGTKGILIPRKEVSEHFIIRKING